MKSVILCVLSVLSALLFFLFIPQLNSSLQPCYPSLPSRWLVFIPTTIAFIINPNIITTPLSSQPFPIPKSSLVMCTTTNAFFSTHLSFLPFSSVDSSAVSPTQLIGIGLRQKLHLPANFRKRQQRQQSANYFSFKVRFICKVAAC